MRQEHRHHSDEQIREARAFARDTVADLQLDGALAVAAFTAAVNLRVAKSIVEVQPPPLGVPAMAMPRAG